ncbi:UDP-N-acetylmuramoyl-tripeptide--D-alanyl-D-alanine ligase [Mesorhizobium sp. M7A.F.Ca.CA.001.09.2.1]|uniref:UDP-N-acetylmuramoyl-tripeptide--D-alanyl-D-alanine ligase n=1 Tax=Mesorhizobium ciceri TaxID=39645 RepID=A0AB38T9R8_9HYPH|nr:MULTISPECIES: Mur ligase family protein [Mesorhizobium]RUY59357.1 UDP-N-acetylmuramoyl-tripeptide--D-alanyl-D-alanine ligase [Mesorhizobium sp. M7A.F.Ca.CA.001.13.2.1]RVA54124.1 UDP-N-acetylmuramoyl-tripeptide--D-alanyl-D-alanine ligase [Mesorhizobium sp. M7A.F.Ca.US.001.01.1.1]MDF3216967.1 Mur ligase family protein [Mesorhizobium ciceri]RUY61758.1 UDP-N-acetylmuramoyl-tripeptide--D-alanyl-D-alanine ligase [Mesorhizobium sp. M7A.F.Ca.CA.001.05.1.1]RUY67465.1 UDP-N-acetylmuramoyl-tripeptide-
MNARLRKIRENLWQRVRIYKARYARSKSKSIFIGITGSSGKSTTTALLGHILASHGSVHVQLLFHSLQMLSRMLSRRISGVDYAVVEVSASAINSIKPMAELLRPHVAVVTMVRLEHVSSFKTLENVAREKRALVEALEPGGLAVLNADDPHVLAMASAQRFVTFGESDAADYRITDISAAYPRTLGLKLHWRGGVLDLQTAFPGEHFSLPVVAAAAAALELGVPAQTVKDRIETFQPLVNRCQVISPEGGPHFILDSVKAPWHSLPLALDMIAKSTVGEKRIVLGQLSDFTDSTAKYARAYKSAREIANQVIYVGEHAHRSKASQTDRDAGRFVELRTPKEVSDYIRRTAVPGELILVKSSSNLHLERVALSWTHDIKCWIADCGKRDDCLACGLYGVPFEEHRDFLAKRKLARRRHRFGWLLGR